MCFDHQLLQKLTVYALQQLHLKLFREFGDHLLLDILIPVLLLAPDELEIGSDLNFELLGDELLGHELVDSHELHLEVGVRGLGLQEDLDYAV